jgi:hypothetical protein
MCNSLSQRTLRLAIGLLLAAGLFIAIRPAAAQESKPAELSELTVYHLKNAMAQDVAQTLSQITVGDPAKIAVDSRSNSLIVLASKDLHTKVSSIVQQLDVDSSNNRRVKFGPLTVRVIWLASGMGSAGTLPKDLGPVVDELKGLGIGDLELAGQMLINVGDTKQRFSVRSTPELKQPCGFQFEGSFAPRESGNPTMQIRIDCTAMPEGRTWANSPTNSLASLQTNIETPMGQYVVLGTTMTGKSHSVFVVQLRSQTAERGPGAK